MNDRLNTLLQKVYDKSVKNTYISSFYNDIIEDQGWASYYSSEWSKYFDSIPNINVIPHLKSMLGFCHFESKDSQYYDMINHIKVYIPLDESHIEEGVKRIFSFLAENNILHSSKVRDHLKSNDNVVIRLCTVEDAKKLEEFIKSDRYIQEGLLDVNPFTVSNGQIGFVSDGIYSYNSTVELLVRKFINSYKNPPSDFRDNIANYFREWLNDWYNKTFVDKDIESLNDNDLYNYMERHYSKKYSRDEEYIVNLLNVKQIADILKISLDSGITMDDYYEYYAKITDEKYYYESYRDMDRYVYETRLKVDMESPRDVQISDYELGRQIGIEFLGKYIIGEEGLPPVRGNMIADSYKHIYIFHSCFVPDRKSPDDTLLSGQELNDLYYNFLSNDIDFSNMQSYLSNPDLTREEIISDNYMLELWKASPYLLAGVISKLHEVKKYFIENHNYKYIRNIDSAIDELYKHLEITPKTKLEDYVSNPANPDIYRDCMQIGDYKRLCTEISEIDISDIEEFIEKLDRKFGVKSKYTFEEHSKTL